MEPLELLRQALNKAAAQAQGHDHRQPRIQTAQIRLAGYESDIRAWPVDTEFYKPLQDNQGNFNFMVDFSAVDGPDPIG